MAKMKKVSPATMARSLFKAASESAKAGQCSSSRKLFEMASSMGYKPKKSDKAALQSCRVVKSKSRLAGFAGSSRSGYKPGTRVRISEGSGSWSNKKGVIVDRRAIPLRRDGSGIPDLTGHYSPVDWGREVGVKLDNGELITMFKNRVHKLEGR